MIRIEPAGSAHGRDPLVPAPCEVVDRTQVCDDVVTLVLDTSELGGWIPGQFNMLTAFGVGEAAISVSNAPGDSGRMEHTVRDVGPVTHALCAAGPGDTVGVRGPYGAGWVARALDELDDGDVVVVAGGIGLAPLRGAVETLAARQAAGARSGSVFLAVGARSPEQLVFADDLHRWADAGVEVATTVDTAGAAWHGDVGVVTGLLPGLGFDPARTTALVCGPEVMMRFTIRALIDTGMALARIRVSLERNMQCGIGWCGHCQLGPVLLCRDGPVLDCSPELLALLSQRER